MPNRRLENKMENTRENKMMEDNEMESWTPSEGRAEGREAGGGEGRRQYRKGGGKQYNGGRNRKFNRWEDGYGYGRGEDRHSRWGNGHGRQQNAGGRQFPREDGGQFRRRPSCGGKMLSVEFSPHLISALHQIAVDEGQKSLYQIVRKACYEYVRTHRGDLMTTEMMEEESDSSSEL